MVISGEVKGGVIILPQDVVLPEGSLVQVVVADVARDTNTPPSKPTEEGESIRDKLMKFAGICTDMPADSSENHDHYLYGTPRR